MRPEEGVEIEEPLANHDLVVVYVLRDALKDLWRDRHPGHAARAWRGWYRKTLRCRGILAHCRWPLDTNLVEGINNKTKVIKRMAYGFRETPTSS